MDGNGEEGKEGGSHCTNYLVSMSLRVTRNLHRREERGAIATCRGRRPEILPRRQPRLRVRDPAAGLSHAGKLPADVSSAELQAIWVPPSSGTYLCAPLPSLSEGQTKERRTLVFTRRSGERDAGGRQLRTVTYVAPRPCLESEKLVDDDDQVQQAQGD